MKQLPLDLINNSQYYDWFAALLLCESVYVDKLRIGEIAKPSEEYIRLGQKPTLLFPPQPIYGINHKTNPPWLMQYFFGVFGSHGSLPLHLTEYAIEQEKYQKDVVFTQFINIFQHRALALFYRSWRLAQPVADFFPEDNSSFTKKVESLVGVAEFNSIGLKKHAIDKEFKRGMRSKKDKQINNIDFFEQRLNVIYKSYVFQLARASRSIESLKLLLGEIIGAPIDIKSNLIEYLNKQSDYYSKLGQNESFLGKSLQLGSKVLSAQSSILIIVGPIDVSHYNNILLHGYKIILIDVIRKIVGLSFSIKIEFIVQRLNAIKFKENLILGHNFWLGCKSEVKKISVLKI